MLTCNDTRKLIGLKDVEITNVEEDLGIIKIHLEKKREACKCPRCSKPTDSIHDYRTQVVKDSPAFGKGVKLILRKRRYRCKSCGKCFYEKHDFLPKYYRMTTRLSAQIIDKLRQCVSYTHVAREMNLSVTTVMRIFDSVSYGTYKESPDALSIDEFKGNLGHQKYQTIMTDPLNKKVLDILPSRTSYILANRLKTVDRSHVKYTVSDMSAAFGSLLNSFMPDALHCADKYHVTRLVVWALEHERKQVQKILPKEQRRYFKRSKSLLNRTYATLAEEEKQQVNIMLYYSANLSSAHYLKESFFNLRYSDTPEHFKKGLADWICTAQSSGLPKFQDCAKTLSRWFSSICNANQSGITNGFTEGCNNKIKVLKRISYGLRNFTRTRNRILHIFA